MNKGRGMAGKGARDLADRRYISRQKYVLLLLLICGAPSIFLVSGGSHSNLWFGALILPLIALVLVKAIGRRIDQSIKEERRAVRGAKGEELIGAMLEGLGDGFLVFHDLPSPSGNIDHLVISKRIVFLIETKAHGGRVSIVKGEIRINQRPPEKDFIAQVLRNRAWLSEQLEAKLSTKIWIEPILVFANAYVENPGLIRNVQVIPKAYLLNAISRSTRSRGASKLWQNKEVLSEIFTTVLLPSKADLNSSPPALPPSAQLKVSSSLELPTSSVPKNANLAPCHDGASTVPKQLPSPIRQTPMGAVYRLGSSDGQKPGNKDAHNLKK